MALLLAAPAVAQNYGSTQNNSRSGIPWTDSRSSIQIPVLEDGLISNTDISYVTIDGSVTAEGMLGEPVYDIGGDQIATVDDVVLNEAGQATMVIVSRGGFLGLGEKLAAFDYNLVTRRDQTGDIIMPLGEQTLEQAIDFTYDQDNADENNSLVMPATSYRLSDILDAEILDPLGNEVAEVENATINDSRLEYLVLDLEETTDVDDDIVGMRYSTLAKTTVQGELDFQLTSDQTRMLESFVTMKIPPR